MQEMNQVFKELISSTSIAKLSKPEKCINCWLILYSQLQIY